MTVATLLRLAEAFDTDLEIKFRPFSRTLDSLATQGPEYFVVPSFDDEYGAGELGREDQEKVKAIEERLAPAEKRSAVGAGYAALNQGAATFAPPQKKVPAMAANASQEQYGSNQGSIGENSMALRYSGTQFHWD